MRKFGTTISRHLNKIRSPIRPLQLPYHAEILAKAFADAPSPVPSPHSRRICRNVEKYLDVSAAVDTIILCSDTDNESGRIEASSDEEM